MENLQELQERINIQEEIFFTVIANYADYKFIHNPTTDSERETIRRNSFIGRVKYNFWMIVIIDLCKLFSGRKEKYCFHKLVVQLEENYWKTEWKQSIPRDTLKELKKSLNSSETQTIIEKVTRLRDKLYAHRDSNFEVHFADFRLTLTEIETLIELGKEVIFEINSNFFNSHTFFTVSGHQTAQSLINRIDNN